MHMMHSPCAHAGQRGGMLHRRALGRKGAVACCTFRGAGEGGGSPNLPLERGGG